MSAAKAQELMEAANKKATQKPGFFSGLMGNAAQRFEDAAEMYKSAGNQFKMVKMWGEAGNANNLAAQMMIKADVRCNISPLPLFIHPHP